MRTYFAYSVLVILLLLACSDCTKPHYQKFAAAESELGRLVGLSQQSERCKWWPATKRLGQMSAVDNSLRQQIWKQARVNTLGMKFVRIETGSFTMGPDLHRVFNIQCAHSVEITEPYYMMATEVTNAQYQQLVPDFEADDRFSPDRDSPAIGITWEDANRFCQLLSEKEGVRYRLPTEAEWEYACRAGSQYSYCFGNDATSLSDYAWHDANRKKAAPVALLKPNNWGLYDMHGNAFEWVSDWHSHTYYAHCAEKGTVQDPQGPTYGRTHALRGGGWHVRNTLALTSAARFPLPVFNQKPFGAGQIGLRQSMGFRIVRSGRDSRMASSNGR